MRWELLGGMDEHIIYAIAMLVIAGLGGGRYLGLGKSRGQSNPVSQYPLFG